MRVSSQRRLSDESRSDVITKLEQRECEVEQVRLELFALHQQLGEEKARYSERKCRTKHKLQHARFQFAVTIIHLQPRIS